MNTNAELIFNKKLDENITIECFVNIHNNYYEWEFKIKGKQDKTFDKFKINTNNLTQYSPFAGRPNFYKRFRVISVFKGSENNLIFLLDKFGQVDVQVYSLSNEFSKKIIPVKKYQLTPMDTELLGEDFQDVKLVGNVIYSLSKHVRNANGIYYIDMININDKKIQEASVNTANKENTVSDEQIKPIITLEDSSYKTTGYGYRFLLSKELLLKVEKDNSKYFFTKTDFKLLNSDLDNDINKIIEP